MAEFAETSETEVQDDNSVELQVMPLKEAKASSIAFTCSW
jgi:hypothetical protein